MRYSFGTSELNNCKGSITESLVKQYIEKVTIPSLKKEGWEYIFFNHNLQSFFNQWHEFLWFYTSKGICPNDEFTSKLEKLDELKREPDGFLVKLKKTGKIRNLKMRQNFRENQIRIHKSHTKNGKPIIELEMKCPICQSLKMVQVKPLQPNSPWSDVPDFKPIRTVNCLVCKTVIAEPKNIILWSQSQESSTVPLDKFPEVDGEIEVIEVKSDKAHLQAKQRENYAKLTAIGYPLRFFSVKIVCFEKNQFEVKEKLFTSPNEVKEMVFSHQ